MAHPTTSSTQIAMPVVLLTNPDSGILTNLLLKHAGSTVEIDIELNNRLNLFTGDNGLGKTFLLDVIWWLFTGTWATQPILSLADDTPEIQAKFAGIQRTDEWLRYQYDFNSQRWPQITTFDSNLVIYMQSNGNFSVWDATRQSGRIYQFDEDSLWHGLQQNDKTVCNGLIRDLNRWQYQPNQDDSSPFQQFSRVLKHLSPHPGEEIRIGQPTRISLDEVLDYPTLDLVYGNVPIAHISAGMKRILNLAYLLVWSWYEHQQAAKLRRKEPTQQLILLVDELETHLHPRWQRAILPAILRVMEAMQVNVSIQTMITTHSPLVLASAEPHFDVNQDKLFLFELEDRNVTLNEMLWSKQGDAVNWLVSDIFGLPQARSTEAEVAINAANQLMDGEDLAGLPEYLQTKEKIHQELLRLLAGHDRFWPRWIMKTQIS
ncbi:ATP-binding protein [Anaerolineales bacterium HSG6]|nr:ATP-binding protein [Anaerolineales bacterium HSG6]